MNEYTGERTKLERVLRKAGWRLVSENYSQGVWYGNYEKDKWVIHLEFGESGEVFGEEVEKI